MTTKGQVTIPKEVRDRQGIRPGSEVDFVERNDGVVALVKAGEDGVRESAIQRSLDEWFRLVEGTGDSGLSADGVLAMTRDRNGRNHY